MSSVLAWLGLADLGWALTCLGLQLGPPGWISGPWVSHFSTGLAWPASRDGVRVTWKKNGVCKAHEAPSQNWPPLRSIQKVSHKARWELGERNRRFLLGVTLQGVRIQGGKDLWLFVLSPTPTYSLQQRYEESAKCNLVFLGETLSLKVPGK